MIKSRYLLCLLVISTILPCVFADTGTYEITREYADIIVNSDGTATIEYYIDFAVTGGNIPWVTVGLPNSNFEILSKSGAASSARKDNRGGWTGVYIDLDKTYYKGESFVFGVKVLQRGLIIKSGDKASLQFIPVWWDNAVTKNLKVTIQPPPEVKEVVTTVQSTSIEGNKVIWQWSDVGRGAKNKVGVLMPLEAFPTLAQSKEQAEILPAAPEEDNSSIIILALAILGFFVIGGGGLAIFGGSSYKSPHLSFGGDSEVIRHINMDCPSGHGKLEKRDAQGVVIDYCPVCGGIQFDKGEVESLVKKELDESKIIPTKEYTSKVKDGDYTCPRCDAQMYKKLKDVDGKEAIIFVCEDCEGVWMNKGNYQIIKDKRVQQEKQQKERKEKSKDDDDDSWIYPVGWWLFASNIGATGSGSSAAFSGGSFGGGGSKSSSSSSSGSYVSSCVSCACVAACAACCACAGSGANGCLPKDNISHQIKLLYEK